jgi:translation initiation factor 4E
MTEVISPIAPPTESMDKLSLESHPPTTSSPTSSTNNTLVTHNEPLTVFHDPKNFNIKHPLMHTWTLWFTKTPSANGPKESWADLLKEVITFDSVEEFWGYSHHDYCLWLIDRIFNNISKTSEIPLKSDYALFKKGVRPEWEDAANEKGGKWSFQFKRNVGIDELWLYTVPPPPFPILVFRIVLIWLRCLRRLARHLKRKEMMKSWESSSMQGKGSTESACGQNLAPTKKS